ncbi:MAG: leucine-rich repeat domain-containing protein, partial [Muribaculaceae bacterium]|nr:leucine-rich repeat domain-containing protein [Muribaculaceae bacterium]
MRTSKIRGACTAKLPNIARILAAVIFLIAVGLPASAATRRVTVGNLNYTIDDATMEAEVTEAAVSSIRNLVIPDDITYEGATYTVTSIGQWAFGGQRNCQLTGSLTIGNNIRIIGRYAFNGRGFTGSLTIGTNVTTIEQGAFQDCSGFTGSLVIPDNVTTIGEQAFRRCSGFTGSLTFGKNVTTIGDWAFHGCSGFTGNLTIPEKLTAISEWA